MDRPFHYLSPDPSVSDTLMITSQVSAVRRYGSHPRLFRSTPPLGGWSRLVRPTRSAGNPAAPSVVLGAATLCPQRPIDRAAAARAHVVGCLSHRPRIVPTPMCNWRRAPSCRSRPHSHGKPQSVGGRLNCGPDDLLGRCWARFVEHWPSGDRPSSRMGGRGPVRDDPAAIDRHSTRQDSVHRFLAIRSAVQGGAGLCPWAGATAIVRAGGFGCEFTGST